MRNSFQPGHALLLVLAMAAAAPSETAPPATVPPVTAATLLVVSTPPGAVIYLDDEPLGSTDPVSGRLLKPGVTAGRHRVRVSARGFLDAGQDLDLGAGVQAELNVSLVAPPAGPSPGRRYGLLTALALLAAVAALMRLRRSSRGR